MKNCIQTGLRLPEQLYNQLREASERTGVSINSQILYLIDVGMQAVSLGVQEERRVLSHNQKDTDE